MTDRAEISRRNGALSCGPVTERGKMIASKNATTHGLLARKPPLLVTEDLSSFEGLVQGLVDHYQPESPIEHFLIQQTAMGMLKQHRLWAVEAAIANIEILKAQKALQFPDHVTSPDVDLSADLAAFSEKRTPINVVLRKEANTLARLIKALSNALEESEKLGEKKTLAAFRESLKYNYFHEDRAAAVWSYQDSFEAWLENAWNQKRNGRVADFQEAIARATRLVELARVRISEILQRLKDLAALEEGIQQAQTMSQGIQNPNLYLRYQQAINRDLYEAIDRLDELQERKNKGFLGSFGKIAPSEN
ncbi:MULTISPECIES: hypothetical protein [unclassified Leptolyngbya]|uniref:hypothetical protein n=1 Tax=unclassified Leptolyngbya TaxID=2650499 RepID=UPI001684E192|nr:MULTISPECIES: hypothetical protein [unclassified Leptolyngbya]MBD1913609.1 hypothetical protein [Leptolyngbya sp. FACHB-8]MBD2154060.1 hypothetical protein [Leptolyngbya sp. FACHB-16]